MSTTATTTETPVGFDQSAFDAFLATRDEPEWMLDIRRQAFAAYQELLTCPLDPEEWKRVELRAFRPGRFGIQPASNSATSFQTLMQDRAEFGGAVSYINGSCQQSTLSEELAAKGVVFGNICDLAKDSDLLEGSLFKAVNFDRDRFAAWHAAFMTGGMFLYVPEGVTVEQPLYSLIALSGKGAADFSHTLIILEEGASATLLEETASIDDSAGLHVGSVELLVAQGAQLQYVQLQNWNDNTWHFGHQCGNVDANAFIQWTVGGLGAKLAHIHQDVNLEGRGASAQVNGVTFATERQVLSYYTQQTHNAPDTRSDLLYKDVLRDKARVIWRGMIKVDEIAQQTDGYQRNDALLLTPTCRMDAIPGLEIEADDVRCTHGATAGRVDEEQIFYCMCRGMTEYEAMHMIVEGFFQIVSDRIPVELVRETLNQAIEKKLGIGD
ncbi:MAG: Fe-S cluster assembly protein SufD [Planctomycetaceae bacterium]|nr:Fe-S cluster assembly protein SufD [Planctomycetaceae bacterium]